MRTNAHKYTWLGQKRTQNSMGNWWMLNRGGVEIKWIFGGFCLHRGEWMVFCVVIIELKGDLMGL
jgi:hypothetical protein